MSKGFLDSIRSIWRTPTPTEMAAKELAESELARLQQQSASEWAAAMVSYQDARIKRLRAYLRTRNEE